MSAESAYDQIDTSEPHSGHSKQSTESPSGHSNRTREEDDEDFHRTWFDSVTFSYLNPLIEYAKTNILKESDVLPLPNHLRSHYNRIDLETAWKITGNLGRALISVFGHRYFKIGIYLAVTMLLTLLSPLILHELLTRAEDSSRTASVFDADIIVLVSILTVSKFIIAYTTTQYAYQAGRLSVTVACSLKGAIYNKLLVLSSESRMSYDSGTFTNLYTTDVERVQDMVIQFHRLWSLPLFIFGSLYLLYNVVGAAMIAGIVCIVVILYANKVISATIKIANDKIQKCKDERMQKISNWLTSSLIVKLNAWEAEFKEDILQSRSRELVHVWELLYLGAVNICVMWLAPCVVSSATIGCYAAFNDDVSASKIFTALALFKSLQDPFRDLPTIVTQYFQMLSSFERLSKFFCCEEKDVLQNKHDGENTTTNGGGSGDAEVGKSGHNDTGMIVIPISSHTWRRRQGVAENGEGEGGDVGEDLSYMDNSRSPLTADATDIDGDNGDTKTSDNEYMFAISFSQPLIVPPGSLVCISGKVGTGKSSILSAILNEMYSYPDIVDNDTAGDVAYDSGGGDDNDGGGGGGGAHHHGSIHTYGSIAYCSQTSFVMNDTLLNNILMNKPLDHNRLYLTLQACNLLHDLNDIPGGIRAYIGEKGIGLSGGQKARVALARCIYANSDILLLDDVFSALDHGVACHVYENALKNMNLAGARTRVLVTHNPDFIADPDVDVNIHIENGHVEVKMRDSNGDSHAGSGTINHNESDDDRNISDKDEEYHIPGMLDEDEEDVPLSPLIDGVENESENDNTSAPGRLKRNHSFAGRLVVMDGDISRPESDYPIDPTKVSDNSDVTHEKNLHGTGSNDSKHEQRATGSIGRNVYLTYIDKMAGSCFQNNGWKLLMFLTIVQLTWQSLSVGSDLFLSYWTNQDEATQREEVVSYIWIYSVMSMGSGLIVFVRTFTISISGYNAGKQLFEDMLNSILEAPQYWLDVNPTGRIMNRFSDDQSKVDTNLPFAVGSCFAVCFGVGASMIAVTVITKYLLILLIPVGYVYFTIMGFYLRASRELQRMSQVAQSPILSLVNQSLEGLSVINAYQYEDHFLELHESKLDLYSTMTWNSQVCSGWFVLRIQAIGALIIFAICFLSFSSVFGMRMNASLIGLSISYGLNVCDELQWVVMILAWCEIQMVCPERILGYCGIPPENTPEQKVLFRTDPGLEQSQGSHGSKDGCEGDIELSPMTTIDPLGLGTPPVPTAEGWVKKGNLTFHNVYFRYQPTSSSYALENVSFKIHAKQKIGIVGRTGSGKSTICMALFRIAELTSGSIFIDDHDISNMSVYTLRQAIEIIPQQPVMLSGTLRYNLDPFGKYTDIELMEVVKRCHLDDILSNNTGIERTMSKGSKMDLQALNKNDNSENMTTVNQGDDCADILDYHIMGGGRNLSVGQRQCVILVRAIIRQSKILLLDEATANIDVHTEALMQRIIDSEFKNSTMITIAHRTSTLAKCDKIVRMAMGKVISIETPETHTA